MTLDIKVLARLGAQARLAEIESERAAIIRRFPGLTTTKTRKTQEPETAAKPKNRKRRKMTAEQREAARARMKAYWENRKKR